MARERGLAKHVPAGLEQDSSEAQLRVLSGMKGQTPTDPLDERKYGKTIRSQVQEFGVVFALLFTAISGWQWLLRDRPAIGLGFSAAALVFFCMARYAPRVMHPIWKGWMAFGGLLGAVVNALLLGAVWLVMVIPIALLLRIIGKRVMDLSFRAPVESYWKDRKEDLSDFTLLERQY